MNAIWILPMILLNILSTNDDFKNKGVTEVRYNFYDSSVPPQYHRSYVITMRVDTISIVVDSYGDILADKKFPTTKEKFDELIDILDGAGLKNVKKTDDGGCTGGTGESLSVYKEGEALFAGTVHYCGGKTSGNMKGSIDDIKSFLIQQIPDFTKVLNRD